MKTKYFKQSAIYATHLAADQGSGIAVVTGGRSGIGQAIATKIASFPFIDTVLSVSRNIQGPNNYMVQDKIVPLAADVTTEAGRATIVAAVLTLCRGGCGSSGDDHKTKKQLRYLVHSAGSIEPIKPVLQVQPDELRQAMLVNCEAPLLLSTALYPYMLGNTTTNTTDDDDAHKTAPTVAVVVPGRILHVSSGAAHGAPPVGWSCYGISKAAFYQSARVLQREWAGRVVVGTFQPGVVDTAMQTTIRAAPSHDMPTVARFIQMKKQQQQQQQLDSDAAATYSREVAAAANSNGLTAAARPPTVGTLDTPANVAFFVEYLLLGTTDEEFANEQNTTMSELYPRWIAPENLKQLQ